MKAEPTRLRPQLLEGGESYDESPPIIAGSPKW